MLVDRARVLTTLRVYAEVVEDAYGKGRQPALFQDEDRACEECLVQDFVILLREACERTGLHPLEYAAALLADPELSELQRRAMDAITIQPADPGPYDELAP